MILGVAQTLAKVEASPEQEAELLARLVTRARDLAQLVERFELAIDAGLTERVDVGEVARDVAARDQRVRVTTADGLPPTNLNRGVAGRILEELVDNALRFSAPETDVVVTVGAGSDGIEVRVVDEGPGIDAREHERDLRSARTAGGAQRSDPPGSGHGAGARSYRRSRDGRRRRDRILGRRRFDVPVDDRSLELTRAFR